MATNNMNKKDAFDKLWINYDYCMMGYEKEDLYKKLSKKEVLLRLKEEIKAERYKR